MSPDVVSELEAAQVDWQLLLGDVTVRTEPRPEQGPEAFQGVDMHRTEPIAIVVTGNLANGVTDGLRGVAPLGQSSVDSYASVYTTAPGAIVRRISGSIVACWTFSSIRMTTSPVRWSMPKIGGFSRSSVPRPRSPFNRRRRGGRPALSGADRQVFDAVAPGYAQPSPPAPGLVPVAVVPGK